MAGKGNLKTVLLANLKASPAKTAVLAVALVVFMIVLGQRVLGGASPVEAGEQVQIEIPQPVQLPSADSKRWAPPRLPRPEIEPVVYRNPFSLSWVLVGREVVSDETGQPTSQLQLQATLTSGTLDSHSAIISGLVVHVGDRVAGYEVVRISNRRVELQNGGERIALTMR